MKKFFQSLFTKAPAAPPSAEALALEADLRRRLQEYAAGVRRAAAEKLLPPEQRTFVQQRIETYRDEMLRYELHLEYHRRRASREVFEKLLAGREAVLAMPILYLNSDEWMWEQQQLQVAVEAALGEFGLSAPPDVREPTTQAARACEEWASTEAKRLFDEELGGEEVPAAAAASAESADGEEKATVVYVAIRAGGEAYFSVDGSGLRPLAVGMKGKKVGSGLRLVRKSESITLAGEGHGDLVFEVADPMPKASIPHAEREGGRGRVERRGHQPDGEPTESFADRWGKIPLAPEAKVEL